ncbi:uncharacterized protein LOC114760657 [Neltuma alba]|uniref:uncharacterized protein LOC114760657 n=1 Tax=Neltuma alba TaxID=207710 RepID=UPI0010A3895B|nr:uncharacterized protein LOC114760657 [Prosopis alba]
MDSSATLTTHHHHPNPLPEQQNSARKHHPLPPPPSSRRTPSFSSSSSSFSPYNSSSSLESVLYFAGDDDDPCPYSPLRFSGGVPFSWEHLPGIPKKQPCFKKKLIHQESSMKLLPLPPPTNNSTTGITTSSYNYSKKNSLQSIFQGDPFLAAMVECSKGDDHDQEEKMNSVAETKPSGTVTILEEGQEEDLITTTIKFPEVSVIVSDSSIFIHHAKMLLRFLSL